MKMLINGKYEDVGFWSFMRCTLLITIVLDAIIFFGFVLLGIIVS